MLLTPQFRYPAYVSGHAEPPIGSIAGLLGERNPEEAIRREAEEAGCRVAEPRRVFEASMSPGSLTERLAFFVAEYSAADRVAAGGVVAEGEDIEALAMGGDGRIMDAR